MTQPSIPQGAPPPRRLTAGRIGVYAFLVISALFFLLPLWIMVVTSLKPMEEIRLGNIVALPGEPHLRGLDQGLVVGLHRPRMQRHQRRVLELRADPVPSVILSIALGAVNGYALSFWRVKGANVLFGILLLGAFIPYQVFLYPLVRIFSHGRHLQFAPLHRHRPRDLRPADDDAPVPQLLCGAADRAVQGGAHRRRRLLDDLPAGACCRCRRR